MEERKRRNYNHNIYSIEGNAARKLQVVPDYQEAQRPVRRQETRRKSRKRQELNTGMDIVSMLILTFAIVVTVYICLEYLSVQSNISQMNKDIVKLESNLIKIKNENASALSEIETSLDLNYIYEVATEELGMVYPRDNQVISYESNLSDYVRQHGEIPEVEKPTLIDKILN
ncbi:septum formation initiator family protein [Anaerocolumna aminovalerica]|uniref:septum formation initiator family protein n=1 Tax=Anaerocolumna aminovalerica TaxID=1527 RepID=UPI001C0EA37F|nr:septum formation initiator family protein [Anaerocolumna aminovalerica]MBU5331820.1 septum formation initiator family protein [Anaerocolumna aminovalerica]